jgi:hypothetical protein
VLTLFHNLVTRLMLIGFFMTFKAYSFIICLKKIVYMLREVELMMGSQDTSGNSAGFDIYIPH